MKGLPMLQEAIISMHSVHDYDNENADSMDFSTDGFYSFEEGVGCMTYMESEITGMEGTRTSVFVMPDRVIVDRDGSITSRMEFAEGEKSSFLYNTPFGRATLGIRTRRIDRSFDENGGKVTIDYVVDMNHAVATRNRFSIEVRNA